MTTWSMEEFAGADIGDAQLNRRLLKLPPTLADKPTASISVACSDWAETQAVYRYFDQARDDKRGLGWQTILAPHIAQTEARMRQHPVVLCLQDTTELDFNGQETVGLGPLSYEAQRGMYLQLTYAVTPQREPQGVTDAWMWAREPKAAKGHRPGARERIRWTEGYERIAESAGTMPETRLVYVADREAYILAKKPIPKTVPTIREVICPIAMLGGFLGRKSDGEPGVKTLWLGFQRIRDFVEGVEHMRAIHA